MTHATLHTAIATFAVATCLATPAGARYFEFYNCGAAQPFVGHDIIKDHDRAGNRTGAHSEFHDCAPANAGRCRAGYFRPSQTRKTGPTLPCFFEAALVGESPAKRRQSYSSDMDWENRHEDYRFRLRALNCRKEQVLGHWRAIPHSVWLGGRRALLPDWQPPGGGNK